MSRVHAVLSRLPDCDDALRRLSDVLRVPSQCRKQACRREGRCQGGYGPPCFFERREFFSETLREGLHEHRDFWVRQREAMKAALRR
jgi:hypothetical protein